MTDELLTAARAAFDAAPPIGDPAYLRYCHELGRQLTRAWPAVVAANDRDVAAAQRRGHPPTLVNRLRLTDGHLDRLLRLTADVAAELPAVCADGPGIPAGDWGTLRRVPKPLGVVLMIYEARPTVTVDGALLPVVVGNAVLLRGGREIAETDAVLAQVIRSALVAAGLPPDLVTVLDDPQRRVMRALLARPDQVDVLVPRGSPSLIDHCRSASTIPLIASGGGVNHLYVHRSADLALAATVTLDSKLPEPAGCTSVELVLVDEEVAGAYVAELRRQVEARAAVLTLRLDPRVPAPVPVTVAAPATGPAQPRPGPVAPTADPGSGWRTEPLEKHDLGREFLDPTIGVLPVSGLDEAVRHIRRHGSAHTEGVVATDRAASAEFARRVDAATIVVNGSLRLHDGPKLGLGPEIAIATGRLHVRGPVTLDALMTSSWLVEANGELRG